MFELLPSVAPPAFAYLSWLLTVDINFSMKSLAQYMPGLASLATVFMAFFFFSLSFSSEGSVFTNSLYFLKSSRLPLFGASCEYHSSIRSS